MCHSYLSIALPLLRAKPFAKHCEGIAADPALQQAIVSVMLEHCLVAVVAAIEEESAGVGQPSSHSMALLQAMVPVLNHHGLDAGIVRSSGALAAAAEQAAAIVRALPVERPSGMAGDVFSALQTNAVAVLALCATTALEQLAVPQPSLEAEAQPPALSLVCCSNGQRPPAAAPATGGYSSKAAQQQLKQRRAAVGHAAGVCILAHEMPGAAPRLLRPTAS